MEETNLVALCAIAFGAVFGLLVILAAVIRLLTVLFPKPSPETDAAVVSAVSTAVGTLVPSARVTRIEEEPPGET